MKTTIEVPMRQSIPFLGDDNTAAEYQAALDVMHEHMNEIALRQGDLRAQEDEAMFGKGDLAEVQKQMNILAIEFGTLQKRMEGTERRLEMAKKREAREGWERSEARAKELREELTGRYRELIAKLNGVRDELADMEKARSEADNLANLFVYAGRQIPTDCRPVICFRAALADVPAADPAFDARTRPSLARLADAVLKQFLSQGGPLFNQYDLVKRTQPTNEELMRGK